MAEVRRAWEPGRSSAGISSTMWINMGAEIGYSAWVLSDGWVGLRARSIVVQASCLVDG